MHRGVHFVTQVTRDGEPSMGVAPRKGCAEGAGAVGGLAPAPFVYLQSLKSHDNCGRTLNIVNL